MRGPWAKGSIVSCSVFPVAGATKGGNYSDDYSRWNNEGFRPLGRYCKATLVTTMYFDEVMSYSVTL